MKFVLCLLLIPGSLWASAWTSSDNPYLLDKGYKSLMGKLPLEGRLSNPKLGWPGSHWANNLGGISHRWSSANPQNFSYKLLSLEELKTLEPHELNVLSPAEKFDIYRGDYNYSTVQSIWKENSPDENDWHGICHGYAPAALHHPEPARVRLTNPDGIQLTFYSSDVAGLLSHYYARIDDSPAMLIGTRCNYKDGATIPNRSEAACSDLNAGAFYIVLTNQLGLKGRSFIADIDPFSEVWNHVPVSYSTRILAELPASPKSALGTLKRYRVLTTVNYAAAIAPKFDPVIGTPMAEYARESYEYLLELDDEGNIIGGEWISKRHPDFAWTLRRATFKGVWKILEEIYIPAE